MSSGSPVELVEQISTANHANHDDVVEAVRAVAVVLAWCHAQQLALHRALETLSPAPEVAFAEASRIDLRSADRIATRAATGATMAGFDGALSDGTVSAAHLDVVTTGLRQLEPSEREALAQQSERLLLVAQHTTPTDFAKTVRTEVRRLQRDGGESRLQQQQRNTRLRTWTDKDSGMWCMFGRFDPETGLRVDEALRTMLEASFAESTPSWCPTDPIEKQDFLRAQAMLKMIEGGGVSMGRPRLSVVVDARPSSGPVIDWGLPVELPERVLRELFAEADIDVIVVRNGVVLHAPGALDLGRTTRLANRAQRRVLRALYATCAVPGCSTRFHDCDVHHVIWFRRGGRTDLNNLVPLCNRHHHQVHEGGWELALGADRSLRITLPDGTVMATGPPTRHAA
jgi:hypothetical protein